MAATPRDAHLGYAFHRGHDAMGSILSMQWPVSASRHGAEPPLWSGAVHMLSGAVLQVRGRVSVLRGLLFHNDIMRAIGYRQQLVGMLQRIWRRDRVSIEAWVDSLLRRKDNKPRPATTTARRRSRAHSTLHQEI